MMCGICGVIYKDKSRSMDESALVRMRDSLFHRGPDDAGIYLKGNVGLGSRRLSILDLSANGHMPMSTIDGRFWIVYNGEVYNFAELRSDLLRQGVRFRSNSDTEVLLYLYQRHGPQMLQHCNGMFAFAIWDTLEETLFLARDRMGVKPLYYVCNSDGLYFASEQKAFFVAGLRAEFDESSALELLLFRYVAGEKVPYKGVRRLLPGHYLLFQHGQMDIKCWYHLAEKIDPNPGLGDWSVAIEQFTELFDDSIRLRRISDVPVGNLLSGGLDSGSMTATMAQQAGSGVSTFTVRFADVAYDEGNYAKELTDRWRLDYQEFFLPPEELPEMLRQSTYFLDEPLMHGHDPHLLAISRIAKQKVTVLLSGEGADEIMAGYVRYLLFRYPRWFLDSISTFSGVLERTSLLPWRMHKAAQLLKFKSPNDRLVYSSAELLPYQFDLQTLPDLEYRYQLAEESQKVYSDPLRQVMYYEQHTYLQSLLDRNDRMTMGASIECREPFLDYRLVEWAANLPSRLMYEKGMGKAVMRRAMSKRLPECILKHKKWGFGVPWQNYLRSNPIFLNKIQLLANGKLQTHLWVDAKVEEAARSFLAGDDNFLPLVRQYLFFDIWQDVCLNENGR
jgi:asparagine synthase (glutamine-hydrolysing)